MTEALDREIGHALRLARWRLRMSQRQFAAHVGASSARVARAEISAGSQPLATVTALLDGAGFRLRVVDLHPELGEGPAPYWSGRDRAGRRCPAHSDVRRVTMPHTWWFTRHGYFSHDEPTWTWQRRYEGLEPAWHDGLVTSEPQKKAENRARPTTDELRGFIAQGWAPRVPSATGRSETAGYAAARRDAVSARFPGERLVVPAGGFKVRSNDTDYVFRPHSAFAHLTGLGGDREPDAVLVLEPLPGGGHESVLYFRPLAGRDTDEFFADARYGEFWVGARPTLADLETELGVTARHIDEFTDAIAKDAGTVPVRVVRDADPEVAGQVDQARATSADSTADTTAADTTAADDELAQVLSVLRIVKDEWEIGQMRQAVDATQVGFEAVIADLPDAVRLGRGERWVEGVFGLHARHQGNGVGYDSICAAGDHATTLHWIKNTGDLREGDLVLLDAGVELDSLFTADITRTLPASGTFTDAQREIYDAVYAAQEAGLAAVRPGNKFSDVHAAAIRVIAEHLLAWGLLPEGVDVEATLDKEHGQYHRRWMVHGTSHHLGIDVHDCALATREQYMDAELVPGMILTVEPGLYFKADDLLAPERFRGTGVRIEDDVLVTEDGCENLSAGMPRTSTEVEAWIREVQSR